MKSPRLYRIGKGQPFAIANLSKGHPLWGMPASLFNATAPADRAQAAADFIDAQRALFEATQTAASRAVKLARRKPNLNAAALAAAGGLIGFIGRAY